MQSVVPLTQQERDVAKLKERLQNRKLLNGKDAPRRNLKSHTENNVKPNRTVENLKEDDSKNISIDRTNVKIDSGIVNLKHNLKE